MIPFSFTTVVSLYKCGASILHNLAFATATSPETSFTPYGFSVRDCGVVDCTTFPSGGTEEGSTRATRGVYETNDKKQLIAAYDKKPFPAFYSIEEGWKHYASRPYLAGMFIWTGFDYRGEPTPYGWSSVGSYFGMLDQCGNTWSVGLSVHQDLK